MIHAVESKKKLEILRKPQQLDLSVNDLRIMVGCFKAIAYQMEIDDEPYLDADALRLQKKLERKYHKVLQSS